MALVFCAAAVQALAQIRIDTVQCACASGGTGSISVIAEGSAGPFSFLWAGPGGYVSTEQNPADLPAPGQYSVTVTNAYGCAVTLEAVVPECDAVPEPMIETGAACTGAANGSVSISMPGGNAGYAFAWGGGETTSNLSGLSAGSLNVTITNAAGCTREEEITIPEENSLMLTAEIFGECFQQSEGGIDLSVNGGQAPYTFQWNNVSAQEDLGPVNAGVYQVTVTDATGCTALSSFTVPQHTPPDISGQVQLSSCANNADGSIQINITNGTAPFEYEWNNGAVSEDLLNLTGGIYILTVTDDNGCFDQAGFNTMPMTSQDALPYLRRLRITAIHTTTAEETLIYDAEWVEAAGDCLFFLPNETDMPQTVFAQIKNGQRSLRFDAEFSEPMMPAPSMFSLNVLNLTGLPAGGNAWVFTLTTNQAASIVQDGRIAETFVFSGIDLRGNALFDLRTASNQMSDCAALPRFMPDCVWSPAVSGNNEDNVHTLIRDCMALSLSVNHSNNSASATALGGSAPISWQWEGPGGFTSTAPQISGVPPGRYCLTAKDANGCTTEECIDFCKSLEELVSDLLSITPPCPGQSDGMLCLNTDGDFALQVSWPDGSDELCMTGIAAGQSYCFEVTELRCMQTVEYCTDPVMPVSALSLALSSSRPACPGQMNGALTVTASGGRAPYVFSWASGQSGSMAAGLAAGICHAVTVTDACGQTFNTCFSVQEAPPLNITDLVVNNACGTTPTGSIRLQLSGLGPMTIVWRNKKGDVIGGNQLFINQLLPGPYRVDVTDACGQTVTMFMDVGNTNTDAQITLGDPVTTPACAGMGGAVDISVQSPPAFPPSFLWSNGATTEDIFNVAPGSYSVTVTNAFGCQVVQFAEVEDVDFETELELSPSYCMSNNGSVRLTVLDMDGPYFISMNGVGTTGNSFYRPNLAAGTYSIEVRKPGETCSKTITFDIPSIIYSVMVSGETQAACGDGLGRIEITSPNELSNVVWSNGVTGIRTILAVAGQYCATVTDLNGCTSEPACFNIEALSSDLLISDHEITHTTGIVDLEGNLFDYATGKIKLEFSGGGGSPYRIQWSTGGATNSVSVFGNAHTITNLSMGDYHVTITNISTGCAITRTFFVPFCFPGPGPVIRLDSFNIIRGVDIPGAIHLSVTGGSPPLSFQWSGPGDFTSNDLSITGLTVNGVYSVTVTDWCGRRTILRVPTDCSYTRGVVVTTENQCRDFIFPSYMEVERLRINSGSFGAGYDCLLNGRPLNIEWTDPGGGIVESGTANVSTCNPDAPFMSLHYSGSLQKINISNFLSSDPDGLYTVRITDILGCEYRASEFYATAICVEGLEGRVIGPSTSDLIISSFLTSSIDAVAATSKCKSCDVPFEGISDCTPGNSYSTGWITYKPNICRDPCRQGGVILSLCHEGDTLLTIPPGLIFESMEAPDGSGTGCLFAPGQIPGLESHIFGLSNQHIANLPVYVETRCSFTPPPPPPDGSVCPPHCEDCVIERTPRACIFNFVCVPSGEIIQQVEGALQVCKITKRNNLCDIVTMCNENCTVAEELEVNLDCDQVDPSILNCLTCPDSDDFDSSNSGLAGKAKKTEIEVITEEEANLIAFPNPFTEQIVLKTTLSYSAQGYISLVNINGKQMMSKELVDFDEGDITMRIRGLGHLPAGVYVLSLVLDKGEVRSKTVIKK